MPDTTEQTQPAATAAVEKKPAQPSSVMHINIGPVTGVTKIEGVRIDFNNGARVQVPEGDWRVRVLDMDTFAVLFDGKVNKQTVVSPKKYYIRYRIEIYKDGQQVLAHNYNDEGQRVLFKNASNAMGDTIAWIPYAMEYKKQHGCEIYYAMVPYMAELLAHDYPDIHFIGPDERPEGIYASYYLGAFFPSTNREFQPMSWKILGLQKNIAGILGLKLENLPTHITPTDKTRKIKEPYVCIASQASNQPKYWNNPNGWYETVKYLKSIGYRVLCIDKEHCYGLGYHRNMIPYGAEDFTGDIPLTERVNMLYHADFFIGLGSGLSWLAWAVGKPVIMISGFSLPVTEFYTPYRVINYNVCNGCWEDDNYQFDHGDFEWCPRHKGDINRQFECTRSISHMQVILMIQRLMADHHLQPQKNVEKQKE